jgi:hypothetical protein
MQFNEDHTPLWEAARQLKVPISFFLLTDDQLITISTYQDYVGKPMSDLPAPYAVPQYSLEDPQM